MRTDNTKKQVGREQKLLKLRLRRSCAWLVGLIYFTSGTLKIMDPTGAGLVMEEYFRFLHMDLFLPVSKISGVVSAFLEITLGAALLTGVWRKFIAISIFSLHSIFTVITAILWFFNPDMDCGCFGEAVHLTHFETFVKNIIILMLLMAAYVPFKKFGTTRKRKYVSFGVMMSTSCFLMVWSLTHLPLIDFTAFKPSTTILSAAGNADSDELYESVFIYSKDGKEEEFSIEELPDSTWTFVDTMTRRKSSDGSSPVLSFFDGEGNYRDELAASGKVMVISIYRPVLSENRWKAIDKGMAALQEAGFTPLLLISEERVKTDMPGYVRNHWQENIFNSDFKTLITLNRSNGGLTYINDGYIVFKHTFRHELDGKELEEAWKGTPETLMTDAASSGSILFQALMLICITMILFV